MNEENIKVKDAAALLGKNKAHLFKVLDRLGIARTLERSSTARGQKEAYISQEDFERVRGYFSTAESGALNAVFDSDAKGVFYLIQLEPQSDPGRFKLGFATNLSERLRSHRTSAPFSIVLATWPCKLLWEKTAIESVSQGCEKLHTEVFRVDSIENVQSRCESFFALMPKF